MLGISKLAAIAGAAALIFVLVFPPWRAAFHPVGQTVFKAETVSLPWPNPSFTMSPAYGTTRHVLPWPTPVFSPPILEAESIRGTKIGVWTTSLDRDRLLVMVAAIVLITMLATVGGSAGVQKRLRRWLANAVDPRGAELLRSHAQRQEQARFEAHEQFYALWSRVASGGAYEKAAWGELWAELQLFGVGPRPRRSPSGQGPTD